MAGKSNSSAPGQYLGFSLQVSRMLNHLLFADEGDSVSLEVVGDVATTKESGDVIAEETKSRTADSNPLTNRSTDLWKTLNNWADAVVSGKLSGKGTRFRLYASKGSPGTILKSFISANDVAAAEAALLCAKQLVGVDGTDNCHAGIDPKLGSWKTFCAAFYSKPAEVQTQIVLSLEVEIGKGASIRDIREALRARFVPADIVDDVLQQVLGWLKAQTDTAIENGLPAYVSCASFRHEVETFIRKVDRRKILVSFAGEPSDSAVKEQLQTKTYIRQLELIELEENEQLSAVNDFLKAECDRIQWAEKGYVHQSSFDSLEVELKSAWQNYKRKTNASMSSHSEVQRGVFLFSECCLHYCLVEGNDPPSHFIRGCLHKLADDKAIGWHPKFIDLLRT